MRVNLINKSNWSLFLSFAVLLGAFSLQYHADFAKLLTKWNSEDFSYCWLVPFVFLYLVYTKRLFLKRVALRPSITGLVVLFFSGVLYLAGQLGSIETLVYVAIWVAVIGLALSLLGIEVVKNLAFPFLILAFIVPLPPFLNNLFTFNLKLISSALSVKMMRMVGLSVFLEGNVIDLWVTKLQVVDACSGLRYVYPLFLMGFLFAYLFHKKWWERAIIVLGTIPISVVSNALRIAITGYLTLKVSREVADSFFHGFSGWLIFMVSLVFLVILSGLLKIAKSRLTKEVPVKSEKGNTGPDSFRLKDVSQGYVWSASLVFVIFWGLHIAMASAQVTPPRKTFEGFPTVIGEWRGEKSCLSEGILSSLWADDYIKIEFTNTRTGDLLLFFVPYYEYQATRHTAHAPVSCLVGGGFAPRSRTTIARNFPPPFGPVKISRIVLEKNEDLILSNYWFQGRGRIILSAYWNKWYLFWDSITRNRTDGALVRLEMPLGKEPDVEAAQSLLDSFTVELMKILPPYVPG